MHDVDATLAIQTAGLTKRFGSVDALAGLDLEVSPGSVFGFLGPNGAGKTTALNILAGLAHPGGGEVKILGFDLRTEAMAVRERIGFLRQDPSFYPWMTARETLAFVGRFFQLSGATLARRTDELLELVGLRTAADRRLRGFSGGMRQRLGIAQALIGNPDLVLLDEPCSALDPAGRWEVIQIMERLKGRTTVFYSTHILQDVERVADAVAIVDHGRSVRQGSMDEILAVSHDELLVEVEGDPAVLAASLAHQPYVRGVAPLPPAGLRQRLIVHTTDMRAARRAVPALVVAHPDLVFLRCEPAQSDLETIFLELTGTHGGDEC